MELPSVIAQIESVKWPAPSTLEWEQHLDPPAFLTVQLKTGQTIQAAFPYISLNMIYVFRILESPTSSYDRKDKAVVIAFASTMDDLMTDSARLSVLVAPRADLHEYIYTHNERVRERIAKLAQKTPWIFMFPWAHSYNGIVARVDLATVLGWLDMSKTPLSIESKNALLFLNKVVAASIASGNMYLPVPPEMTQHDIDVLNATEVVQVIVNEDDTDHTPRIYSIRDINALNFIKTAEERLFSRRMTFHPLDNLKLSPLIESDPDQKRAVFKAIKRHKIIITGGAGSGKTTVIRQIIDAFPAIQDRIVCACFTGKAASRLNEVLKDSVFRAKTVDWYLYRFRAKIMSFEEARILIIDEASMIDTFMYSRILRCFPYIERLILVGQTQQLPPISRGHAFAACIKQLSRSGDVITLKTNHRTDESSGVLIANHEIILSRSPYLKLQANRDGYIRSEAACNIVPRSASLDDDVMDFFSDGRTPENAQIVAHTNKMVDAINDVYGRPHKRSRRIRGASANDVEAPRVGEKVIFRENFYGKDLPTSKTNIYSSEFSSVSTVMNGEIDWIERIVDVTPEGGIQDRQSLSSPRRFGNQRWLVTRSGRKLLLKSNFYNAMHIKRAYAITIHSIQGSEADHVAIFLEDAPSQHFTYREFYVAFTRAKKSVTVFIPRKQGEDAISTIIGVNTPFIPRDSTHLYLADSTVQEDDETDEMEMSTPQS